MDGIWKYGRLLAVIGWMLWGGMATAQASRTYCNPINIDYGYTPIPNFSEWGRHRATADPVIVNYQGDYYLFSTNQWGYWWSSDLSEWHFVSKKFLRPWNGDVYDELCAPAVGIVGDTMLVFGSTYTDKFTLWMSTNPKANEWQPLVDSFSIGGWDPDFFTDDDGRFTCITVAATATRCTGLNSIGRPSNRSARARRSISWKVGATAGSASANTWTIRSSIRLSKGPT